MGPRCFNISLEILDGPVALLEGASLIVLVNSVISIGLVVSLNYSFFILVFALYSSSHSGQRSSSIGLCLVQLLKCSLISSLIFVESVIIVFVVQMLWILTGSVCLHNTLLIILDMFFLKSWYRFCMFSWIFCLFLILFSMFLAFVISLFAYRNAWIVSWVIPISVTIGIGLSTSLLIFVIFLLYHSLPISS